LSAARSECDSGGEHRQSPGDRHWLEGNTVNETINSFGAALSPLTLSYETNFAGGGFHQPNAANNSINGTPSPSKNLVLFSNDQQPDGNRPHLQ
jgi:hypothetical protein